MTTELSNDLADLEQEQPPLPQYLHDEGGPARKNKPAAVRKRRNSSKALVAVAGTMKETAKMMKPQFTTWKVRVDPPKYLIKFISSLRSNPKAMESRLTALMTISALLAGFCLASATSVESSEITDYIEFVIVEFGENGLTTKGGTGMPDDLFRKHERQAIDQRLGWNAMAACTVEMTVLAGTSMLCYVLTSGALGHNMKNEVLLKAFHAVTGWAVLAFQALSITGFWVSAVECSVVHRIHHVAIGCRPQTQVFHPSLGGGRDGQVSLLP